jgi:hypothetical protein
LLGTAHKHANSVAEILCIGDELQPQWPQKKGPPKLPLFSLAFAKAAVGRPTVQLAGCFCLILQESWHMVGIASALIFAL